MIEYICAIKRGLRDDYGFEPGPGSTPRDPLVFPPDGVYPIKVDGTVDYVVIKNNGIGCCNFSKPKGVDLAKPIRRLRNQQTDILEDICAYRL